MKALTLVKQGFVPENFQIQDLPVPSPKGNQVLVKVHSAALNPVDWKMAKLGFLIQSYPVVLGCDISGVVEAVGENVKNFKKNDAVWAFTELGKNVTGAFQEYAVVDEDMLSHKPENISFEEASTLGVGSLTAALALFYHIKFPVPSQKHAHSEFFLVWGASSSVGTYAVQLAAASGQKVIGVCSPQNFDYVKSLGATHLLDYKTPNVVQQILDITGGNLKFAIDCVGSESADLCVQALTKKENAILATVAGQPKNPPANVSAQNVFLGGAYGNPDMRKFLNHYLVELHQLLSEKKIHPNKWELVPHGGKLEGVPEGLLLLQSGKVSGKKLVAHAH